MAEQQVDQNQIYYQDYYRFQGRSKWMEKAWSDAFGEQYPAGLQHYGYLTNHDLSVFSSKLQLPQGASLLDIGCGKGGPGLKLAEQLSLRLTGVDVVEEAIIQAEAFKQSFSLSFPATFKTGHFYEIPLEDASMDAVICIDSLWAAPDKLQAMREIRRVMKLGAKFIFTYWDLHAVDPVPYFEQTGMRFISRGDTPDWKVYQQKVYEGILAHEQELVGEMGARANMLLFEAKASPAYLDLSVRRIYEMEAK